MKTWTQTCVVACSVLVFLVATPYAFAQSAASASAKKTNMNAPTKAPAKGPAKPLAKAAEIHTSDQPVVDTVFAYPAALGAVACDDSVSVTISRDAKRSDGFDVLLGKTHYPTTRVETDSGAIRLENKASGIVWLQMANKSMLFNEKAGKRLANNCRNEAQTAAEKAMETSTAPTVLDAPEAKKP